ncbi:MarR family transcriptional regulator [Actinomycetaceae bacterium L2_0104]
MEEDVQWLSADEQLAWRTYLRGVAVVSEALNHDLIVDSGVSLNEYEVLSRLSETPEYTLRMSTLAEGLVHSRSRLTHTVSRLESEGLVARTTCEADRRGVNCSLTEKGLNLLKRAAPLHVASVRRHLVDKLGAEGMLELGRLCSILIDDQPEKNR